MKIINFIKYLYCRFNGHKPENNLIETDYYLSNKRCSRCKCQLGLPHWKFKNIPPPNSTPEQIKSWEEFCENKWQELRNSCN